MKLLQFFAITVVLIFAIIGLLFSGVFVAMEFGWLNVRDSIEERNNSILLPPAPTNTANVVSTTLASQHQLNQYTNTA